MADGSDGWVDRRHDTAKSEVVNRARTKSVVSNKINAARLEPLRSTDATAPFCR